jgi:hypothetical protein
MLATTTPVHFTEMESEKKLGFAFSMRIGWHPFSPWELTSAALNDKIGDNSGLEGWACKC